MRSAEPEMVNYRRQYAPTGLYFFTVALKNRRSALLVEQADLLGNAMRAAQARWPWETVAIVIMPDHLHAIWQLPDGDTNYATRWRDIKSSFVRSLTKAGHKIERNERGETNIWQARFWEHVIRDDDDLQKHIDYIHFNPVRHGHVARVADWPYSSFHRHVKQGLLPSDWAEAPNTLSSGFGE